MSKIHEIVSEISEINCTRFLLCFYLNFAKYYIIILKMWLIWASFSANLLGPKIINPPAGYPAEG